MKLIAAVCQTLLLIDTIQMASKMASSLMDMVTKLSSSVIPDTSILPLTETKTTDELASLDSLFESLAHRTKALSEAPDQDNGDDLFQRVQKSVASLPQIKSSLEENLEKNENVRAKQDIVRINDPIVHKQSKSKKQAPTDAGDNWFNMRQPEMTDAVKRDLQVIKHRSALDPKRHYKKDKWQTPKFFQMGSVVEGNTEFYLLRMNRRDRGKTLVEEILKDDDTEKYFKRKFSEIQANKRSGKKGHYKAVQQKRRKF